MVSIQEDKAAVERMAKLWSEAIATSGVLSKVDSLIAANPDMAEIYLKACCIALQESLTNAASDIADLLAKLPHEEFVGFVERVRSRVRE